MLSNFREASNDHLQGSGQKPVEQPVARPANGALLRLQNGNAAQFYGETSFFQISPSVGQDESKEIPSDAFAMDKMNAEIATTPPTASIFANNQIIQDVDTMSHSLLTPQSPICQHLMSVFFQHQYYYHMCFYREYFLRDYKAGEGPYYSDLLMYAICALAALVSEDEMVRNLSDAFSNRAQELLYGSALESPNLTTLQALLLLGHRDIGRGKGSKGWLFTGMLFS